MHLAVYRLRTKALEKILIAIGGMKAAHAHHTTRLIASTKNESFLLVCELLKRLAKV